MLPHCLKCKHKKHSKNPSVAKTKKEKLIMLSKCALRDTKNSRFIKEQDASGLFSSLEMKTVK